MVRALAGDSTITSDFPEFSSELLAMRLPDFLFGIEFTSIIPKISTVSVA
jgi:hypothetical protein